MARDEKIVLLEVIFVVRRKSNVSRTNFKKVKAQKSVPPKLSLNDVNTLVLEDVAGLQKLII